MDGFKAVFKRELKGYFATPIAYVFLVIFLFASGYWTFKNNFYEARQAELRAFFEILPIIFIFMVSATAMRLWAEERRTGSVELLFTLPITVTQAVLGKFFAGWCFLGIALLLTFPLPITLYYLGDPDTGLLISSYLGSFLMAGAFLAIGSFFSAVTKNQVISGILSVSACSVLFFTGLPTTLNYLSTIAPTWAVNTIESFSLQNHLDSLYKGIIEFKDVSYFVILIVGWIYACSIILNERKAS